MRRPSTKGVQLLMWSTLIFLLMMSTNANVSSFGEKVNQIIDEEFAEVLGEKKSSNSNMPTASRYYCDVYCRDPRESVIWSNKYDFSKCSCQVQREITRTFTEKDVEAFWEATNNFDKLEEVLGKSETLTSRLTKSYKVFTPVAAFMADVLVFIIGMYWGHGFGTTAAIVTSFGLFFSKGGSFYQSILSTAIRIAIGQVSPGMRNFNYIAIVAVLVQVFTIAIGTTAGSFVAVPLLFLAAITSNGIIVMLTQSNKFRMEVVVSIILITMQFIQTIGEVLPIHFVSGRSYINLLVLFVRALCNSSTANSDLTAIVVYTDVTSTWASMPITMFSMFEDLQTAFFAILIFFLLVRFASIISMRLMLAQIPFKNPDKQHSFTEWAQRISMTCLYFPFRHFENYSMLQAFVNIVFFLWTFRCSLEIFFILVIIVVVTWAMLGDFCVSFDIGKGKILRARKEAARQIERHFGDNVYATQSIQSLSVPEQVIDRHIEFLKEYATMPAELVKSIHRWDIAIQTSIGKASGVLINNKELLTVKHVFMNVASALPNDLKTYAIHFEGKEMVPYKVEAGNSDIDGETILKLSFEDDLAQLDSYPTVGSLDTEDYAMHMMYKQGSYSMTKSVHDIEGRPQLIGYGHTCGKTDSGRAGYAIDGTAKLVSLHVGTTAAHNCGLLIYNPKLPFRTVAVTQAVTDDRDDADDARGGTQYKLIEVIPEPPPLKRHVGVRKKSTPIERPLEPADQAKLTLRLKKNLRKHLNRWRKQVLLSEEDTTSVVMMDELLAKL